MAISDEVLIRLMSRPGLTAAVELAETLAELLSLNSAQDAEANIAVDEICGLIQARFKERRATSRSPVAYELAIIGGQLSEDESTAFDQIKELHRIARCQDGYEVGPWEYHFPNVEQAKDAARGIRQMGLACDDIQIKAVDESTGNEPTS